MSALRRRLLVAATRPEIGRLGPSDPRPAEADSALPQDLRVLARRAARLTGLSCVATLATGLALACPALGTPGRVSALVVLGGSAGAAVHFARQWAQSALLSGLFRHLEPPLDKTLARVFAAVLAGEK